MLLFYFRSALRSIRRKTIFSILNTAGLVIGICSFLFALEYYSFEKGFNEFHSQLPHLYRVNVKSQNGKSPSTFPALAPIMEKNIPGVRKAIRFGDNFNSGAIISYSPPGNAAMIRSFREEGCVFVDAAFLDAFSFPLLKGSRQLTRSDAVVITSALAKKLFGEQDPVGKILQLNNQFGKLPLTVTGVLADLPAQSDISFDCLLPMEILNSPGYTAGSDWARPDSWGNDAYTTFVWLNRGTDPAAVAAKASALWQQNDADYKPERGFVELQPMAEIHLGSRIGDDNPTYGSMAMTYFIMALGILVLCIAWINYINFSTAFALSQVKQIGIHKMIGSGRRQILIRYITESLVLNSMGLLLAGILSYLLQPMFGYLAGKPLALRSINDLPIILYSISILLTGIILSGGYVGWILSKFKPVAMMQFNKGAGIGNMILRKGLVIFQFFVSGVLIAATLIAFRQIDFMRHHDLGMTIDKLMVINGPALKDSTYKTNSVLFRNELARLPFVEKISTTGSVPGAGFAHNFGADGITGSNARKGDERKQYFVSEIDENYFDTYRIRLLKGNDFSSGDADRSFKGDKLILNETAAREMGYDPATAVGQPVTWGKQYRIAGIVKDYNHRSLREKIEPIVYVPQHNNARYTVRITTESLPAKIGLIQALYQRMYPGNPFEYEMVKDTYDSLYAGEERAQRIALSISVLVIVISCLGLTGLSIFTARLRNKEMGIRKVLGASVQSLFVLLSGEFFWLVGIAFLAAIPVTWITMNKWLEGFAFRTNIPPWIFLLAGSLSLFIAFATVSIQAIRTARANPIGSLRAE